MAIRFPPLQGIDPDSPYGRWLTAFVQKVNVVTNVWKQMDFTGSNLTDIQTRNHNDLQNIQGGATNDRQHLTTAQFNLVYGPQSVNVVFAGPISGSNAPATFRAIDVSDLPNSPITPNTSYNSVQFDAKGRAISGTNVSYLLASNNLSDLGSVGTARANLGLGSSVTETAAYTVGVKDDVIRVDATSATFAVTLPAASSCSGKRYTIKKIDSSANAITVTPNGTDKIDGAASSSLSTQYQVLRLQSNGSGWDII